MIINHNMAALNTYRQMSINNSNSSKSLEKLSSGLRINRAGDDAAGLAISEKMRGQIRGLDTATRNAQDGISLLQTAEGALNETHSILQRMRELAVQASNDTNATNDRGEIQKEIDQLISEVDRIGNTTEFNTKKLINGAVNVSAAATDTDTADLAKIKILGGTGDTTVGASIVIKSSTAATAATETKASAFSSGELVADLTFSVNGTQFSFASGTSDKDVAKTINDAGLGVTATYTTTDLTLTAATVGSASKLSTTMSGSVVDSTGIDATITAGTGANYTQYSAQGNTITIEDGDAKGLQFSLSGELDGTTNDTTITVSANGTLNLQIGANQGQNMNIGIGDMRSAALGIQGIQVTDAVSAGAAVTTIQSAIDKVSAERSKLGAYTNRLEHTVNNLGTSSENLTAAESRVRDVDMAKEMMNFQKNSILQQAAQAMLAQANQQPQGVLQLLK